MTTHHIANKDAHRYTGSRLLFKGSNLYSERIGNAYVVFSYGPHWPLYIHADGRWYENATGYSATTNRHRSVARPREESTTHLSVEDMRELLTKATLPASAVCA